MQNIKNKKYVSLIMFKRVIWLKQYFHGEIFFEVDILQFLIMLVLWVDSRVLSKNTSYSNKKDHVSLCFKSSHSFYEVPLQQRKKAILKIAEMKVCVYKIWLQRIKVDLIPTTHFRWPHMKSIKDQTNVISSCAHLLMWPMLIN